MGSNEFVYKKGSSLGKVIFYIVSSIVALLLAILLFATLMTRLSGQTPSLFSYSFFCVTTDGYAKKGDFLMSQAKEDFELKVNKVIVYQDGTDEMKNSVIKTAGIASVEITDGQSFFRVFGEDKLHPQTDIIGEVSFVVPILGSFVLFIKTPMGLICCVAVPLLLLLIFEIINLIKLSREQRKEDKLLEGELPSYMRIGIDESNTDVFGEVISTVDILGQVNNDYLFEQQDEILEVVEPKSPFISLSYQKPELVETQIKPNSIYSTKEFKLEGIRAAVAESAKPKEKPVLPISSIQSNATEFSASINTDTTNNFNIEGIAVKVQSDAVKLSLDNDTKSRDISITVTKEYTNVIVESGEYEVNFALFKDETDKEQKVIIQKKTKN